MSDKKSNFNLPYFKLLLGVFCFLLAAGIAITILSAFDLVPLYWLGLTLIIVSIVMPCFLLIIQLCINSFHSIGSTFDNNLSQFHPLNQQPLTSSKLTYQNYEKITTTTTIAQAKEILGEGKETFSGKENAFDIKVIMWQADVSSIYNPTFRRVTSNLAMSTIVKTVTIKFKDGKAVEKSQIGL